MQVRFGWNIHPSITSDLGRSECQAWERAGRRVRADRPVRACVVAAPAELGSASPDDESQAGDQQFSRNWLQVLFILYSMLLT